MEWYVKLPEYCKFYNSLISNKINLKDTSVTPMTYNIPYIKAPC
jgi:hypothetical protein